jgi:Regulator of Chromosome Condensation (RCC1) repeat protein
MKTHGGVPTRSCLPLIFPVVSLIWFLIASTAVAETTSSLTLLYPNGSETMLSGENHIILWESPPDVNDVRIDYSTDNGGVWNPVDPPNQQNTGGYDWLIPIAHSDQCLLRISDVDNPDSTDTSDQAFAVYTVGALAAWGQDTYDQTDIPWGDEFVAVSGGGFHSLALRLDGSLAAWGRNSHNQSEVPSGNDFIAVACGYEHNLALKKDGSIFGWGRSNEGQISIPNDSDFVAIAAGGYHSLAIKDNGSLVGWGKDSVGQATVPIGNDYTAVAAGWAHSIALKDNGTVVGWGYNGMGEIDIPPDANDISHPVVAISAGSHHNLALKSNGTIVAWGDNDYGQTDVPVDDNFIAIAAGGYHSLARKSDGTIVGWGRSSDGQIDSQTQDDFVVMAAGYYHSLGLRRIGLTLLDPNGHEVFQATDPTTVRWRSRGQIDDVIIEYSSNNGLDWSGVIPSNSANTGSYEWSVPAVTSDLCYLRLRSSQETNIGDSCDESFTIFECTLQTDLNGDCVNDFSDLVILCELWLASDSIRPCPLGAELAGNDCLVNQEDFAVYSKQWLHCGNPFDPECIP